MEYLLIDTNIWLNFLRNPDLQLNLEILDSILNGGKFNLLVPKEITEEWQKHSTAYITEYKEILKKSVLPNDNLEEYIVDNKIQNVQQIIERIYHLLSIGIELFPDPQVDTEIMGRYREKKAPFHKNSKSHNDASLFLTTISFLKSQSINKLIFISNNTNEFSDPENKNDLHGDLKIDGLEIEYKTNIESFIGPRKNEYTSDFEKGDKSDKEKILYTNYSIKKLPITSQIKETIEYLNDQINFIPLHILPITYPFKVNAGEITVCDSLKMITNNKEIIDLLNVVEVSNGVIEYIEEVPSENKLIIESLLKFLNKNLIYKITDNRLPSAKDIKLNNNSNCSCITCSFERLDFLTCLTALIDYKKNDIDGLLKKAYINANIGNFQAAFNLLKESHELCLNERKYILEIFILYNIDKLSILIRIYGDDFDLFNTVKRYFTSHKANYHKDNLLEKSTIRNELANWLFQVDFYKTTYLRLDETLEKIKAHYYSQLRGGHSTSTAYKKALCDWAEFSYFNIKNYIIEYNPHEYEELFDKVLESLIISNAMYDTQMGRLTHFDDYILLEIVKHGNPERIARHFNQYGGNEINYQPTNTHTSFPNQIFSFLDSLNEWHEIYKELTDETKGYYFSEKIAKIIKNTYAILSIVNLPKEDVLKLIACSTKLINSDSFQLQPHHFSPIKWFLGRKIKLIDAQAAKNLLEEAIYNEKYHKTLLSEIARQIKEYHKGIEIKDVKIFSQFKENILLKQVDDFELQDVIIQLYAILESGYKKEVKTILEEILKKSFDSYIYYHYSMYDIIDYKLNFPEFLSDCKNRIGTKPTTIFTFAGEESYNNTLSSLINLVYKFNINIEVEDLKILKGVSDYYDWLLGIDEFDYTKFNPLWTLEYQGKYYLQKIFSSKQVRKCVKKYLQTHDNARLSKYYIEFTAGSK